MKVKEWIIEEEKESGLKWTCIYSLVENSNVNFIAREIDPTKSGLNQYQICFISSIRNFPFSIDSLVLVREIKHNFPECANGYSPNFGLQLITNNLSELFQWIETLKVVLATLYQKYGVDVKGGRSIER